jgi:predicted ATPase
MTAPRSVRFDEEVLSRLNRYVKEHPGSSPSSVAKMFVDELSGRRRGGESDVREGTSPQPVPFVRRLRIRGYRSIARCDVTLGPLTVLVGFNASGKSNILDALRFVRDALQFGPAQAAAERGGLRALLHRSAGATAESFRITLDLGLRIPGIAGDLAGSYGFAIGPDPAGEMPLRVLRERGEVSLLPSGVLRLPLESGGHSSRLRLSASVVTDNEPQAVLEAALRTMRFYELDSTVLRALDEVGAGRAYLGPAGEHLGRVLGELAQDATGKQRLDAYLSAVVPGALRVDERLEGRYSTVHAGFRTADGAGEEVFLREELSEGTVRAAGVLAALFQPPAFDGRIALLGIEEPESALHPAGVGALYEALDDASARTQVIVTSQSSDLLDSEYTRLDQILVVSSMDGTTQVGPVDAAGRTIVEKGFMTISELHRSGQMRPDLGAFTTRSGGGLGR